MHVINDQFSKLFKSVMPNNQLTLYSLSTKPVSSISAIIIIQELYNVTHHSQQNPFIL